MTSWKSYKLINACTKIGSGATPRGGESSYISFGISLIRSQNVLDFVFSNDGLAFINEHQADELSNVEIEQRDVLVNITGDSVARVCQVPPTILPARVNQHVSILRANQDLLDPEFLKYSLLSRNNKEALLSLASTGATRKALTKGMLEEFEINAPEDVKVQTRIASILSSLDEKIELNRQMNHTLDQMAQALFKKYFVEDIDPENLPEGWRWGILAEVTDFTNGYAFSSKELLDYDNGHCYRVFKMGQIKRGGGFNSEETKSCFDKDKAIGLEKYILKKGDILMCMTDMKDSMALLGHTALMNENDRYIVNQRVGLIRLNNSAGIDYPFLSLLTNSREFIEDLRSRANSGVQVNLSTAEIKNSAILIAPKDVNEEFNLKVKPLFERTFQIAAENELLSNIRDLLLPKLMNGEIEVTQPSSQHASVLS